MKELKELTFGFKDAENYRRRENKDIFSQIFLRTDALTGLGERHTFFLVGEKGTGKTAYAVYLSNNPPEATSYTHKYIRETEYLKFIQLKEKKALSLSDYTDIWKVILYLLIAGSLIDNEPDHILSGNKKDFEKLRAAIEEYYENAFSPEVMSGLQLVENSTDIIQLLVKHSLIAGKAEEKKEYSKAQTLHRFQTDLLKIQRSFEGAFESLSLTKSHTLFIDGIDIRPENVPFGQYLDCVKGLTNALWMLNNDTFPKIRDSKGRLKVVALLRPDIFNSLGMQNRNTKLKDNSVVLDWRTDYSSHRESALFKLSDRLFSVQQDSSPQPGVAWDHYFPFHASGMQKQSSYTSFITILRYTYHRPRDILSVFSTLDDLYVKNKLAVDKFEEKQLISKEFRKSYANYMLGELKDSLSFYYTEKEFELFLKFFEYLDGNQKFDYHKYLTAYAEYMNFIAGNEDKTPDFMDSAEDLLQFLFDQNVLCYIEETDDGRFIRWCFKERSPSNISPKVKTHSDYEIHYGLANALNTGKVLKNRRKSATAVVTPNKSGFFEGNVKFFNADKMFGFIVQDAMPIDVFYHQQRVLKDAVFEKGDRVRFRLEKDRNSRLMAVDIMAVKGE